MMHKLIHSFAYENFGSDYHVAPQGHNKAIQPLALIAKDNLSFWRRAAKKRPRKTVVGSLKAYIASEENIRSKVFQAIEKGIEKGRILKVNCETSASSSTQMDMEVGDTLGGHADRSISLGELNLSSVQEEYFNDISLREILSTAKLDPEKVEEFEKKKLYIITGVVYSEQLQIGGKREDREEFSAHVKFLPRVQWINSLTYLKAGLSWTDYPAPSIERSDRSPLLFTFAKVKYNPESSCLELQQLVGPKLKKIDEMFDVVADCTRGVTDSRCPTELESVVTTKEQGIYKDLMESSENEKEKKLQVVKHFLEETESLSELCQRTRKYLNLVEKIMETQQMALRTEAPFPVKDLNLLRSTGVEIEKYMPNNAKILRITAQSRAMVLEFGQIFYHLQVLTILAETQEDEWMLLKGFSENPKDTLEGKSYEEAIEQEDEAGSKPPVYAE